MDGCSGVKQLHGEGNFFAIPMGCLSEWRQHECTYIDAASLSRIREAKLVDEKGAALLKPGIPGRLWTEHSQRPFMSSSAGCLEYDKSWLDMIGG